MIDAPAVIGYETSVTGYSSPGKALGVGNSGGAEGGTKEKLTFGLSGMMARCKRMANYK